MVLSGCISGTKAYESIQWRILVLIAGMLAMGQAMDQTGAAQWIAEQVSSLQGTLERRDRGGHSDRGSTADRDDLQCGRGGSPRPRLPEDRIATGGEPRALHHGRGFRRVAFIPDAGRLPDQHSCYGAGGYKFTDFARVGAPRVIILWAIAGWLIPVIWPL